jgi:hypothetical protein
MVRSFFEPPDPYTSKVLNISLLEAVQNLTGAVLQFQLKTVLTPISELEQIVGELHEDQGGVR